MRHILNEQENEQDRSIGTIAQYGLLKYVHRRRLDGNYWQDIILPDGKFFSDTYDSEYIKIVESDELRNIFGDDILIIEIGFDRIASAAGHPVYIFMDIKTGKPIANLPGSSITKVITYEVYSTSNKRWFVLMNTLSYDYNNVTRRRVRQTYGTNVYDTVNKRFVLNDWIISDSNSVLFHVPRVHHIIPLVPNDTFKRIYTQGILSHFYYDMISHGNKKSFRDDTDMYFVISEHKDSDNPWYEYVIDSEGHNIFGNTKIFMPANFSYHKGKVNSILTSTDDMYFMCCVNDDKTFNILNDNFEFVSDVNYEIQSRSDKNSKLPFKGTRPYMKPLEGHSLLPIVVCKFSNIFNCKEYPDGDICLLELFRCKETNDAGYTPDGRFQAYSRYNGILHYGYKDIDSIDIGSIDDMPSIALQVTADFGSSYRNNSSILEMSAFDSMGDMTVCGITTRSHAYHFVKTYSDSEDYEYAYICFDDNNIIITADNSDNELFYTFMGDRKILCIKSNDPELRIHYIGGLSDSQEINVFVDEENSTVPYRYLMICAKANQIDLPGGCDVVSDDGKLSIKTYDKFNISFDGYGLMTDKDGTGDDNIYIMDFVSNKQIAKDLDITKIGAVEIDDETADEGVKEITVFETGDGKRYMCTHLTAKGMLECTAVPKIIHPSCDNRGGHVAVDDRSTYLMRDNDGKLYVTKPFCKTNDAINPDEIEKFDDMDDYYTFDNITDNNGSEKDFYNTCVPMFEQDGKYGYLDVKYNCCHISFDIPGKGKGLYKFDKCWPCVYGVDDNANDCGLVRFRLGKEIYYFRIYADEPYRAVYVDPIKYPDIDNEYKNAYNEKYDDECDDD